MADYRSEDPDGGFKKTFVAIAAVHLILLGGLLVAALFQSKKNDETVVWMNPGSFGGESSAAESQAAASKESMPVSSDQTHSENQLETPAATNPPEETPPPASPATPVPPPIAEQSELPVSTPSPKPRPSVEQTPRSTPQPNSRPTPRPSPKATPKPPPIATPKVSPAHSATPKSSPKNADEQEEKPKRRSKAEETGDDERKTKSEAWPKPKSSPVKTAKNEKPNFSPGSAAQEVDPSENKLKDSHGQTSTATVSHSRTGSGTGPGDNQGSGSGDSALAGYVGILTNRFQAAWNQPTSEMALGKMLAVTVKLKIESDGTVTEFEIIDGSGNAVVDDSVREAGKKIVKLPPPPNGEAFSAPVRFELGN